jgi:hypothetical protein
VPFIHINFSLGASVSRYVAMVIDFPSLAPRKQLTTEFVRPAAG